MDFFFLSTTKLHFSGAAGCIFVAIPKPTLAASGGTISPMSELTNRALPSIPVLQFVGHSIQHLKKCSKLQGERGAALQHNGL